MPLWHPLSVTTAPTGNNGIVITARETLGSLWTGRIEQFGVPCRMGIPPEDYTDWNFASTTNDWRGLGDIICHSPLIAAVKVREGEVVFLPLRSLPDEVSGTAVHLRLHAPVGRGDDALHPGSIIPFNSKAAWLSRNGFRVYNGGTVSYLDCPHDPE